MSSSDPHGGDGASRQVARACDLLGKWTGFELRGTAPRRVKEFLQRRAERLGYPDVDAYVGVLEASSPADEERQHLINLITNGLTAFWRDEPQLEALTLVLREIRERRSSDRPLQVWCAGTSTGEEAYTVAMIALENEWPVFVHGTDLNTDFIEHAREAVFGTFSLRRVSDDRRERYFEKIGRDRWAIDSRLTDRVRFEHRNLLSPAPRPERGTDWDVILCRNVFIYLADDSIRTILSRFSEGLHPQGYLLLGSSEQLSPELTPQFRASRYGRGFVYRRTTTDPAASVPLSFPTTERRESEEAIPRLDMMSLDEETTDFHDDDAVIRLLNTGVEHLNGSRRETALACFEAAVGYDPFVAETYCLMGVTLKGAGAPAQSVEAYEKALFLDPLNWFAAWEAGQLHERAGDLERAARNYRQALEGFEADRRPLFDARLVGEEFRRVEDHRDEVRQSCRAALKRIS